MTYDDYMKLLTTSTQEDWGRIEDANVFFYKKDLMVWIREDAQISDAFVESWTAQFPDQNAYRVFCNLHYGATIIGRVMLVSVDGGRATLPIPVAPDSKTVRALDYKVAEIIDDGLLDEYMSRAGFTAE
jgi:hypothetical protein